jgi:large subunit ribosomal protein L13
VKTYSQKPTEVQRVWYVIDAASAPFGRLASTAAALLIGKGKASFTPHVDGGDFVVIINASQLVATGNKDSDKTYYRHSGFPGGIYSRSLREQKDLDASALLRHAIRGMLPVNKLRDERLRRLKIYEAADHTHIAQKPKVITMRGVK